MLTRLYGLAVYGGVLLYKLKLPTGLMDKTQAYSTFLRLLNFPLAHGKDLKWLGDGWFKDELNIPFQLCLNNIWWLTSYFNSKGKIALELSNGNLYATVNKLCFHLPSLASVVVINETFLEDTYGFFDVKGKRVLDVGGFIGDTAVYFASWGAEKVVAFEPIPLFFELAKENIRLNGYDSLAEVVNAAVGSEEGIIKVRSDESTGRAGELYEVEMVSFKSALEAVGGKAGLLKMDCEGAEWQIIAKAVKSNLIKNVENIIMEVHGYAWGRMETLLRQAGFQIVKNIGYGRAIGLIVASKHKLGNNQS